MSSDIIKNSSKIILFFLIPLINRRLAHFVLVCLALKRFFPLQDSDMDLTLDFRRHNFVLLESSSVEKDLGIVMDKKLSLCQHCVRVAKKVSVILECIRKSIASRSREVILPFYSALLGPNLDCCAQFWTPRETWSS
ncbi:hypothetical protein HGM15179_017538 [Zosterops borbonicus]|uniref:Uncharacterized protein n=1 Tax=Zosterops borbonicus TaxID=364589 RepID=A0A8K1G0M1_9PASS|nr:hypothetical protein HGM15179_017538 [Zosterops borbonicus]